MKHYATRRPWELDAAGGYYARHTAAMTEEGLHSKADIAAELAWRDMQIDRLQAALEKAITEATSAYRRGMEAGRASYDASAPGRPVP